MEPIKRIEEGLKELYDSNVGKVERQPDVDIYDLGENIVLYVDMPGIRKESIKVRVYDRAIEVIASPATPEGAGKPLRRERISNFPVSRKIEVPFRLRVESAKAVYKDGVLQIVVGKAGEYGVAELKID
ncbi:Hsp20/alpha crystallin family protein [Pyrobaculum aerophilum]|uniref:Small heat shock protein, hsp20 homolog, conjectural n=2 Tax=Pyrobaculum aerophilum TaxID=13773 RepID=Q8ZVI0_PYRAE|nr:MULTISPECIES: Hsp20 family protein [Pyrobaculum]AAL64076.1 small heat shock protein, hsp20 homolog, conjectural [Pyrobaculum aerophilum str. IM2]MCX8135821.1 Hsp20/alpha crystallin family protein [Pyrobaculum aerophilum]HII47161.1 Hsp20/alpha crystallin family protein [Pyrobaculum aerophilum]